MAGTEPKEPPPPDVVEEVAEMMERGLSAVRISERILCRYGLRYTPAEIQAMPGVVRAKNPWDST